MKAPKNTKNAVDKEAAENAERLLAMEGNKELEIARDESHRLFVASLAKQAREAKELEDAEKVLEIAKAAADKAAADKAAAAEGDLIAAATACTISREFDSINQGVERMAKQIQTVISACNGNIPRAAAIVGRERKRLVADRVEAAVQDALTMNPAADTAKIEAATKAQSAVPIAAFVQAAKSAGLSRKSCQDFANGTDLVSRQSVSRAVLAAFADDSKVTSPPVAKSYAERILALLGKDDCFLTSSEAAAITAAMAAAIATEVESD